MKNRADHVIALTVPCRYCGAQIDKRCTNKLTGYPLRNFAAHQRRINDANKTLRVVEPIIDAIIDEDDDEVIF